MAGCLKPLTTLATLGAGLCNITCTNWLRYRLRVRLPTQRRTLSLPIPFLVGVTGVVNTDHYLSLRTGWELGDATTAARFTANDTTLTAGEKAIGKVQWTTGVASATTGVSNAGTAAKIRITCAGGNPGAGKIDVSNAGA